MVADLYSIVGRAGDAEGAAQRALTIARKSGDPRETARQVHALLTALASGPTPTSEALPRASDLVDEASVSRPFEALCRATYGAILAMSGAEDSARAEIRRAKDIARDVADLGIGGIIGTFEAWTEWMLGETRAAAEALRRWLAVAGVTHGPDVERAIKATLADLLLQLGEIDEARQLLAEAASGRVFARMDEAVVRRVRAGLAVHDGHYDDGIRLINEARDVIRSTDLLSERADLELHAARLLARIGDNDAPARCASEATRLYSKKEHRPGEAAARQLLGSLTAHRANGAATAASNALGRPES